MFLQVLGFEDKEESQVKSTCLAGRHVDILSLNVTANIDWGGGVPVCLSVHVCILLPFFFFCVSFLCFGVPPSDPRQRKTLVRLWD